MDQKLINTHSKTGGGTNGEGPHLHLRARFMKHLALIIFSGVFAAPIGACTNIPMEYWPPQERFIYEHFLRGEEIYHTKQLQNPVHVQRDILPRAKPAKFY